jgi:hypothetical protein
MDAAGAPNQPGNKTLFYGVVWKCRQSAYALWPRVAEAPLRCRLGFFAGSTVKFMGSGDHPPRHSERRWAPRFSFRADLAIEWGSAVLRANTRDISSNGMFIESNDPLWIGAGFTAQLSLDLPLKLDCSVKRIEPGLGMGVAVKLHEEHHEKRYQDLLASLSTTRL